MSSRVGRKLEDLKFKAILDYIVYLKPAWVI